MGRITLSVMALTALLGAAAAQTGQPGGGADRPREPRAGGLINQDYLTSTGETVPHPGASQGPGVTPLDRSIKERDDRVQRSICSNC